MKLDLQGAVALVSTGPGEEVQITWGGTEEQPWPILRYKSGCRVVCRSLTDDIKAVIVLSPTKE